LGKKWTRTAIAAVVVWFAVFPACADNGTSLLSWLTGSALDLYAALSGEAGSNLVGSGGGDGTDAGISDQGKCTCGEAGSNFAGSDCNGEAGSNLVSYGDATGGFVAASE
jgi:hypothetical protein